MLTHDYANQVLQNRSFKGLDLTGADFSSSDLRGCDFSGATLVEANFEGVRTGQSRQQINRLVAAAIVAPALIIGLCMLVVQIPINLLGDRFYQNFDFLLGWLPLLAIVFEILFRDSMILHFPRASNYLGVAGVAALFQIMVGFTLFLAIISLSSFGTGAGAQGLFLLVLVGISAIVTRRIFKWVIESIQSSCGTSFRKANLTNANLSGTVIQNTDFCFAVLTGACIFEWTIQHHTQFANVYCEYLYLEPAQQQRHPTEGKFRQSELEQFLYQ
ncbi:pentapeptide repeat-containing protein [Kovacikia minuta CCNUW1]|uniref:pentapeptide repeat-containing protein n=1 Tax=Kovacikia minuta TaxID=2931930 RepID=UPI001CCE558D|nr:pentapeptide repeat-containing protein [Kovacikia minuta]UBF23875.1 pentapeptide repeat-containing protein [Kovacikia minuta CCNUW1]